MSSTTDPGGVKWSFENLRPCYRIGDSLEVDVILELAEKTPFSELHLTYNSIELVEHMPSIAYDILLRPRYKQGSTDLNTKTYSSERVILKHPEYTPPASQDTKATVEAVPPPHQPPTQGLLQSFARRLHLEKPDDVAGVLDPGTYRFKVKLEMRGEWHSQMQEDLGYVGHQTEIRYLLEATLVRSRASVGLFVVHPPVRDFVRLRVLPVFREAFYTAHAKPVSVHKDVSTNMLVGGKVHVTASLASGAVVCDEPFTLTVAISNDSERTIRGVRVQLCDLLLRRSVDGDHQEKPQPVSGPARQFPVSVLPKGSSTHTFELCYPQFLTDTTGKQTERDIVTILGHIIEKRHLLQVTLDVDQTHHDVAVEVPVVICPSRKQPQQ